MFVIINYYYYYIIIIIIFYREGIEYRIYSKGVGGKGGKGGKSCPKYDKVLHERDFLNSLPNQGQDFPPFPPA